jgi:hypothetical protein
MRARTRLSGPRRDRSLTVAARIEVDGIGRGLVALPDGRGSLTAESRDGVAG